jgi:hypothetical protein
VRVVIGHQQPHNIVGAKNKKKGNNIVKAYGIKINGINKTENNNHN